ncbi:GumC family protein [Sphingobacterium kyonggiense]
MDSYSKEDYSSNFASNDSLLQKVEVYLLKWHWFLISIFFFLTLGFLYYRYSEKNYFSQATILLEDEKKSSGDLSGLGDLGLGKGVFGSSAAFVNDQTLILQSRRIMRKVVEDLDLRLQYYQKGRFKSKEISANESPLRIELHNKDIDPNSVPAYSFSISYQNGRVVFSDEKSIEKVYGLNEKIPTEIGAISVLLMDPDLEEIDLDLKYFHPEFIVDYYRSLLSVEPNKDISFALNLSIVYPSLEKGKDILNSVIDQYNKDVSSDKTQVTRSSIAFINSRLDLISKSLKDVDLKLAGVKSNQGSYDLEKESNMNLNLSSENEIKLIESEMQLSIIEMLLPMISEEGFSLLPSNLGFQDQAIQMQIQKYNELILERDDLLKSAKQDNPVVMEIIKRITNLKNNLHLSLQNYQKIQQSKVNQYQQSKEIYRSKLNKLPNQETVFKDVLRDQSTIEKLYMYLLQKREENEIKAAATPAIFKLVDEAYGYTRAVSPKPLYVLIASLVLGLGIPFALIYIIDLLDNKVRDQEDLAKYTQVPIIGEIPLADSKIVQENDRSSLAEAVRILRTNINYMLVGKDRECPVVYVTSTTSGEGKSFLSVNLAKLVEASGKKTLIIGADIRSPKIMNYLELSYLTRTKKGITQYLADPTLSVSDIIISKPDPYQFDIIYSGQIAPNPAELLMNRRFKQIITYARAHYDFVIIDTAPAGLVADTLLISQYADLTLYIVRSKHLDKRMLTVGNGLYESGKLKNMAYLVNAVDFERKYGYGYGYGYGYVDKSSRGKIAKLKELGNKIFTKLKSKPS